METNLAGNDDLNGIPTLFDITKGRTRERERKRKQTEPDSKYRRQTDLLESRLSPPWGPRPVVSHPPPPVLSPLSLLPCLAVREPMRRDRWDLISCRSPSESQPRPLLFISHLHSALFFPLPRRGEQRRLRWAGGGKGCGTQLRL